MAQQIINTGAVANDGTGDPLRTAFTETNNNFTEIYTAGPVGSNVRIADNTILTINTNGNLVLAPNGVGVVQSNVNIVPNQANVRNLGSSTRRWSTLYLQYADISSTVTIGGGLTVGGNLTVSGNIIQVGNIITDSLTIQLGNTAANAAAANGAGITVGANDNIATVLYNSTSNVWTTNIGLSAVGNISAPYFIGNGSLLTGLAAYGNANVATFLAAYGSNTIVTTGNVTAGNVLTSAEVIANGVIQTGTGFSTGGYLSVNGSTDLHDTNIIGNLSVNTIRSDDSSFVTIQDGVEVDGDATVDGILNINGNLWSFTTVGAANNSSYLYSPSGASWYSDSNTNDDYIYSGPGGYINLGALHANGDYASRIHLEQTVTHITLGQGVDEQLWEFDDAGNLTLPTNGDINFEGGGITQALNEDLNIVVQDEEDDGWSLYNTITDSLGNNLSQTQLDSSSFTIRTDMTGGAYQWQFDGNTLQVSKDSIVRGFESNVVVQSMAGANAVMASLQSVSNVNDPNVFSTFDATTTGANIKVYNGGSNGGIEYAWKFDNSGNLTLPQGGVVYETNIPDGGLNGKTIALKPQGGTDADQQLLIYPTTNDANHLHLTSGNLYSTELFLGDDNLYVKLANTGNVVINSNDAVGNTAQWTFGNDGVATLPGEGILQSIGDTVTLRSLNTTTGNANSVYLGTSGGLGFNDQEIGGNWLEIFRTGTEPEIRVPVGRGNLNIQTAEGNTAYNWTFDNTGNLTAPGNVSAVGNITGGNVLTGGLISTTGNITANNLSLAGNITSSIGFTGATITINNAPGGNEGAEVIWALPSPANTVLTTSLVQDVFQNGMRFFESGGNSRGLYMDLGNVPNGAGTAVGYRDIPQVSFTANTTLAATDAGRHYYSTLATANTLTIANNTSVSWTVGTAISVVNRGSGNITIAQGSGVSLYLAGNSTAANRTISTYGMATLLNVAANVWMINGTGVS